MDERIQSGATPAIDSSLTPGARAAATAILLLVLEYPRWMYRRVESIQILDDITVARHVSLDLRVPDELDGTIVAGSLSVVPISFFRKEVLRNFDLEDHEDHPVPMLTRSQNGRITGDTLVVMAEELIGGRVPASVEGRLRNVAELPSRRAHEEFSTWSKLSRDHARPDRQEWARLVGDRGFRDYAAHLVDQFILFADTEPRGGVRRLLKLRYEETFADRGRGKHPRTGREQVWLEKFGWRQKELRFEAPAVNLASSFHFELAAPPDMEIDKAKLEIRDRRYARSRTVDGPLIPRAHLYVSQVPPARRGEVTALLRARRQGFLTAALLVALLMVAVLGAGFAFLDEISKSASSQTAAALLLVGPTLIAAGLIRPGEHQLVSYVFWGARVFIWAEILAAVIAVAVLAGIAPGIHACLWLGALVIAGVSAMLLLVSYVLPRPTSSEEYDEISEKTDE